MLHGFGTDNLIRENVKNPRLREHCTGISTYLLSMMSWYDRGVSKGSDIQIRR
jgi:hypothetical protein